MQPSNEMLGELRTLATLPVKADPLDVVEDPRYGEPTRAAYAIGHIDGRAALARAILEDWRRGE